MSDLAEFLLARIVEEANPTTGHARNCARVIDNRMDHPDRAACNCWPRRIADRWCEAKRRIVEEWHTEQAKIRAVPDPAELYVDGLEFALRCLALPYVDHPDFREEWRP